MKASEAVLLVMAGANLAVTVGIAVTAAKTKTEMEDELNNLRARTNKSLSKMKAAIEDFEV